jgi:hypothetical protein
MLANTQKFVGARWPLAMTLKTRHGGPFAAAASGFRNVATANRPSPSFPFWPFFITETETPSFRHLKNGLERVEIPPLNQALKKIG